MYSDSIMSECFQCQGSKGKPQRYILLCLADTEVRTIELCNEKLSSFSSTHINKNKNLIK